MWACMLVWTWVTKRVWTLADPLACPCCADGAVHIGLSVCVFVRWFLLCVLGALRAASDALAVKLAGHVHSFRDRMRAAGFTVLVQTACLRVPPRAFPTLSLLFLLTALARWGADGLRCDDGCDGYAMLWLGSTCLRLTFPLSCVFVGW